MKKNEEKLKKLIEIPNRNKSQTRQQKQLKIKI